jgi:hypothetical protein
LGWPQGVPQFNLRIYLIVPPLQPRRSEWLLMTVASPPASAFAIPAEARQTQRHHRRLSGGQYNEATKFTSCYGPMSCSPDPGTDFYFRAFSSISHLIEKSNITTWVNSQFPRPDFHRLDTQPYGLHTGLQDEQDEKNQADAVAPVGKYFGFRAYLSKSHHVCAGFI